MNSCKMSVRTMIPILSQVVDGCLKKKNNMKWPLYYWWWQCVLVPNTHWPTEWLSEKSAESNKHTNICPWKFEPTFQCTRRIKTHLLIYHSQRTQLSSWQVSLTCFTNINNLSASSGYERAKTCCVCAHTQSQTWHLKIPHYSPFVRKTKIHFPIHARGYI